MSFIEKTSRFFREVRTETSKVTWPSRDELINSTSVVIFISIVLAIFVYIVDLGLSRLVESILR